MDPLRSVKAPSFRTGRTSRSVKLRHITFKDRLPSIFEKGLVPRYQPSDFGDDPFLEAVYLYHPLNIDTPLGWFECHDEIPAVLDVSVDDPSVLVADEDYFRFTEERDSLPPLESDLWFEKASDSLDRHGVVACPETIPPDRLSLFCEGLEPERD